MKPKTTMAPEEYEGCAKGRCSHCGSEWWISEKTGNVHFHLYPESGHNWLCPGTGKPPTHDTTAP